ncbi:MAG: cytochrome ubiquinol oxidase subunit I [Bacteroidales bacterium]|nr:cytochrome ubiquinol oxidase subunit I [Bacteroidales bacterium]
MDTALIGWSRAQFAMTAAYHWLFVPLTLGLGIIMAVMETLYVVKKDDFWKQTAKFWQKLFGINFAVGVATGIILEFEFGTNWSNYSWFVGDIFGAPLAIEGMLAFFMESTFMAVMYFGWKKVSKGFHLTSTWLTAVGAAISALWILIANAWMQHPMGMEFNPDTVRNEMVDFWALVTNPVAISKFFHAVFSGWEVGGVFVVGVSCWYLLKNRESRFARQSILIGSIVGVLGTFMVMFSGDKSAVHVAKYQPMKLAAVEGLENGGPRAPFSIVPGVEIPGMLSILATHDLEGIVPGVNDILSGYIDNEGNVIPSVEEKIERGKAALRSFQDYRAVRDTNAVMAAEAREALEQNMDYFGYGYLDEPQEVVPPVGLVFWSFRIMIGFGSFCLLVLLLALWFAYKDRLSGKTWFYYVSMASIPMIYIAGECGWMTAEIGRQPWTIEGLLPVKAAVSSISASSVITTFFIFLAVFTLFLVIEVRILIKAIRKGPGIDEVLPDIK